MTSTAIGSSLAHPIGPDGLFSVRLDDGEIHLRAVDGDTIRVRDRSDRDLEAMFTVELGVGSASLKVSKGGLGRSEHGHGSSPDLVVEIPPRATVVIDGRSAEIEVDGLLGDQRYRTVSGDMRLRAVSGRIAVEAVSGDVDVVAKGQAAVTLRTVSGDVALRAATIDAIDMTTTSGDIRIAGRLAAPGPFAIVTVSGDLLLAPAGDVRIEMATLSGDLVSRVGGRSEGGRGRRTLEVGSGGPLVTFRSMSGDLVVVPSAPVGSPAEPTRSDAPAEAPAPPAAPPVPVAPSLVADPVPSPNSAIAAAYDDARLRILRSLESGEIDVDEAGRRLEALDGDDATVVGAGVDPGTETTRYTDPGVSDA